MDILELNQIISLLEDDSYKSELLAFRRSYQRLKIRLRNNRLNAQLKQVRTLINRLEIGFPTKLFVRQKTSQSSRKSIAAFLSYLSQFIKQVDIILDKAIAVYCSSQPHFRVGHLVQHYIVVRASLARLTFCFKALLVYSADLYNELCKSNNIDKINLNKTESKLLSCEAIKDILLKHNCRPKIELVSDSPDIISESQIKSTEADVHVGQLIDRQTLKPIAQTRSMRPMRACKRI